MPITGLKHPVNAYTIEASGTPIVTVKAKSIPDAMRFVLDDEQLVGNGWWNGEEPIAIRIANWIEKDAFVAEMKRRDDYGDDEHSVYWHSRESTSIEDAAYNARHTS